MFLFLGAIVGSVWYDGMGPRLVALALSALTVDYFLLPPLHSLKVYPAWLPYFVAFVLFAFLTAWFAAARRRAESELKQLADQWQSRWQASATLIETNARLQLEVDDLHKRIRQLEETTPIRGPAGGKD